MAVLTSVESTVSLYPALGGADGAIHMTSTIPGKTSLAVRLVGASPTIIQNSLLA